MLLKGRNNILKDLSVGPQWYPVLLRCHWSHPAPPFAKGRMEGLVTVSPASVIWAWRLFLHCCQRQSSTPRVFCELSLCWKSEGCGGGIISHVTQLWPPHLLFLFPPFTFLVISPSSPSTVQVIVCPSVPSLLENVFLAPLQCFSWGVWLHQGNFLSCFPLCFPPHPEFQWACCSPFYCTYRGNSEILVIDWPKTPILRCVGR